jgi:ABC-type uncharacterized transport system substrate-binding protein
MRRSSRCARLSRFRRRGTRFVGAACVFLSAIGPAAAHPHILIDAKAAVQFNQSGEAISVRNVWNFDDAFSAYAIQGYDSKGDGKPSRKDLQPLAEINVKSLAAYNFFTEVKVDGASVQMLHPVDYWDEFVNETLTLRFTLPFAQPVAVKGKTLEIDVFDPEYFAAITFAQGHPIELVDAKNCDVAIHRPAPLDPSIASALAVIPADQRQLPGDLLAVTSKLVNGAVVACR